MDTLSESTSGTLAGTIKRDEADVRLGLTFDAMDGLVSVGGDEFFVSLVMGRVMCATGARMVAS